MHNVPSAIFTEFLALLKEHRGLFLRKICGEVTYRIHHILLRDELQSRGTPQEVKVGRLEQEAFDSPALLKVCNLIHRKEGREGGDAEDKPEEDEDLHDEDLHDEDLHDEDIEDDNATDEGGAEPAASSSVDANAPIQAIAAPTFSAVQAETIEGSNSLQDKLYSETAFVNEEGISAIPGILVTASRENGSDTAAVSGDAAMSTDRPDSMFPGGSLAPSHMNQFNEQSSSQCPMLSKKRNLPTEPEEADVHSRPRKTSNKAQLSNWEPFRETVDVVGRIWRDLDHARIYVTSSIEIKELSAQQQPNQERLWSWLKEDQELFDGQIASLLRKKLGFQVVCSDAHPQGRRYCSLEHMEYWNTYFGDNERGYWLAVLTPWRSTGSSREKVRKTDDDKNL